MLMVLLSYVITKQNQSELIMKSLDLLEWIVLMNVFDLKILITFYLINDVMLIEMFYSLLENVNHMYY